ncbi:MAG: T9SS type A sorting domain-containing protein [Bacteroidetes bacterium]|nr:T9SS type A sorting domain-containing protein [Bacteroidota bacterium]
MNKLQVLLSTIALTGIATAAVLVKSHTVYNPFYLELRDEKGKEEKQEIAGAIDYYRSVSANQITKSISLADVNAAKAAVHNMSNSNFKKTRAFTNLEWSETGPNNIGGRSRILISDKNVPNKLYMGAVGGGFWVSTDNGDSWTKRAGNDSSTAIAVTSIAQAANGDIYYGTGEGVGGWAGSSWVAQIFQLGEGIFKSTDGGNTFSQLASTKPANLNSPSDPWSYVNKLVADPINPDKIYAATYGGFKVTTNGGTTWAKPASLTASGNFLDAEVSSDGNVVAASTGANLYISTDGGATFSTNKMGTNGLPASGTSSRVEVAIAPNDANYIYVTIAATNGSCKGVYKSTDGGTNWVTIATGGSAIFNPFGNQGPYDIAFGVHPLNKDIVFLGGQLDLYRFTPVEGWKPIAWWANNPSSGRLVHADMHCIAFNANNAETMYVATDGGLYRTQNASEPAPTLPFFGERNKNYSTVQCYGIAANYLGRVMFGSQDNGSGLMGESSNSPQEGRDLTGGDGTRCAMSDLSSNFIFSSIVEGELRRASDGGQSSASFKSFFDKNIDYASGSSDGAPDEGGLWVSPIDYKEKMVGSEGKTTFLFGTLASVWMTQGALKGNPVWFRLFSPGNVGFSALTMASDGKTIYAGTQGGNVYRILVPSLWDSTYKYADTVTNMPPKVGSAPGPYTYPLYPSISSKLIGSYPGRFITDLSCDASGDVLLVTLGNYGNNSYIYKSTDAATATTPTFSDITSNLPKMPLYSSICVYGSTNKYIIGTELGIWGSDNGGTSWTELNLMNSDPAKWHPRIATYEVIEKNEFANADVAGGGYRGSIIYTGTHGRGTFRSTSMAQYFPTGTKHVDDNTEVINVYPNPASDKVNIAYEATSSSSVMVRIYSLTGTLIKSLKYDVMAGNNNIPLDINGLAQGGYIIHMINGTKHANATFIKK